jgi:GMP synthase-like glutamine amidotransferase
MRALVLQHIACEPPGAYEDVLRDREVSIERVEVDAGEPIPDWREFDAIVAMGGPMSVNDPFDWLATEKLVVAEAVRAGAPFFGACLGAQLLAASLGAAVYPGPAPEVGLLPVTLGSARVAIQFHLEVSPQMACDWSEAPAYEESLEGTLGTGSFPVLLRELGDRADELNSSGRALFAQWLESAVMPAGAASIAPP